MVDHQPPPRTVDVRARNPVTSAIAAIVILAACVLPIWVMVYVAGHDRAPSLPTDSWFGWPQTEATAQ